MPATNDTITLNEDDVATANAAAGVLSNDIDSLTVTQVNGDSGLVGGAGFDLPSGNGQLILNADGSYTFTPAPNFFGTHSFTYTATDGTNETTATVNITVDAVNDAPDAVDDSATTTEANSVTSGSTQAMYCDVDTK